MHHHAIFHRRFARVLLLFVAVMLFLPHQEVTGQTNPEEDSTRLTLVLTKKKKRIKVNTGHIGLTTLTDTIQYSRNYGYGYAIFEINADSLVLRQPVKYRDTIVASGQYGKLQDLYPEYRWRKAFKRKKEWFTEVLIVESYAYKSYHYKDITSIQYPPDADNQLGCIFCIVIPIVWVIYYLKMRQTWHPRNFNMAKWKYQIIPHEY